MNTKNCIKIASYIILAIIAIIIIIFLSKSPSNDRNWNNAQKILPYSEFEDNIINVYNIRNISYRTEFDYDLDYYNATYDIDKINSLYFVLVPFKDEWEGLAHAFLSFGFEDGKYLALSIEIRKELGEKYSPIRGMFRNYEIIYVIADERDVIKLRSNIWGDDVYLYPVNATKEKTRELFLDMINKTNELNTKPEFYNTITSSCATNIATHVNKISPKKIPFSFRTIAAGFSDELALELGLINTSLSLADARKYYWINEKAIKYADDPEFSKKIRENDEDMPR